MTNLSYAPWKKKRLNTLGEKDGGKRRKKIALQALESFGLSPGGTGLPAKNSGSQKALRNEDQKKKDNLDKGKERSRSAHGERKMIQVPEMFGRPEGRGTRSCHETEEERKGPPIKANEKAQGGQLGASWRKSGQQKKGSLKKVIE